MSIYVIGVTGASGAPYAERLLAALLRAGHSVKLVISAAGERVMAIESGLELRGSLHEKERQWKAFLDIPSGTGELELLANDNYAASIASGSYRTQGMVIVPCSMGTLGRIANGVSSSLIERAADVMLKERRHLILVPREMPLSRIHLRNMLAVTEAGGEVLPAMPGFYHRPQSVDDLVNMVVGRILDRLGLENALMKQWRGEAKPVELDE
ncbi:MAG: UbiX family flavin prenyltransferase [Dehalococcoidia bacterium]|nr:UbiX family flavin prenyltransferase [Dehalococcoidia bacterium]